MRLLLPLLGAVLLLCGALLPQATAQGEEAQLQESEFQSEFLHFTRVYNKTYADASELSARYSVFKANVRMIRAHNAGFARGLHTHTLGVNQFADLTDEEFKQQKAPARALYQKHTRKHHPEGGSSSASRSLLQTSVDWQSAGKVTGVVWDQGYCGCDYAMCTADLVSSAVAIASSTTPKVLSAEQLLDCSFLYGNGGCTGGLPDATLDYLLSYGLQTNSSYPFSQVAASAAICSHNPSLDVVAPLTSYAFVAPSESALQTAVTSLPIAIAVESYHVIFRFYTGGIITDSTCGSDIDHAVLLTGYDTDPVTGTAYWRLKNSWGASWGEQGYARVQKGVGRCGIGQYGVYPIV